MRDPNLGVIKKSPHSQRSKNHAGVRVYLDYAASTPLDPRVEEAMRPYYSSVFGNPSAVHTFGQEASGAVFHARKAIGEALNADYRQIVFTGSATEANNLALRGAFEHALRKRRLFSPAEKSDSLSAHRSATSGDRADALPRCSSEHIANAPLLSDLMNKQDRPKILISGIEHESVRAACKDLHEAYGVEVVDIPVDKLGIIDVILLKTLFDDRVILISVQYANSEIGTIQPIKEIGEIIKNYKLEAGSSAYPLFHTDAVQAFQYLKCDVKELGVDMLTLSAHKIYGPKGIGCLYIGNPGLLDPMVSGGGQEYGMRSGTENVPAIVGFAKAVEIAEDMRAEESKRMVTLRDLLWDSIETIVPDAEVNGSIDNRVPNNLNVYFPGHSAQDACIELDMQGIAVSPGTACSSRASQPSYVIEALGFSGDRPSSSIRFSLGRQTTKAEIEAVSSIFKKRFGAK